MAKSMIKSDCIFVTPSGRGCSALDKMYCKSEDCAFYKTKETASMTCGNCDNHVNGICIVQRKKTADGKQCNVDDFASNQEE